MDVKNTQGWLEGIIASVENKTIGTFHTCEILIDTGIEKERNRFFIIETKQNSELILGRIGDKVRCTLWLNSREGTKAYAGRYFPSYGLSKMEVLESPVEAVDSATVAQSIEEKANEAMGGESSELPF